MYACGVHLYKMLFQRYPFDGETAEEMGRNILAGHLVPQPCADAALIDLLENMLLWDCERRMTVAMIKAHPVFRANLPAEIAVSSHVYALLQQVPIGDASRTACNCIAEVGVPLILTPLLTQTMKCGACVCRLAAQAFPGSKDAYRPMKKFARC